MAGRRLLIVDGNAVARDALEGQAAGWDARAEAVAGGAEGLAALRRARARGQPFDALLVDMRMPGMDGEAMARAMRADPALAAPPIVALASVGEETGDAPGGGLAPFDAWLAKPARSAAPREAVAACFGRTAVGETGWRPGRACAPRNPGRSARRAGPHHRIKGSASEAPHDALLVLLVGDNRPTGRCSRPCSPPNPPSSIPPAMASKGWRRLCG